MEKQDRSIRIHIATKHTKEKRVPLVLLADVFLNIQRASYLIGNYRIQRNPSTTGRYADSIRRELELFIVRAEPGSVAATIEFPNKEASLFPDFPDFAEKILEDLNNITVGIKQKSKSLVHKAIGIPQYRKKIVSLLTDIMPREGADYGISFQYGGHPAVETVEHPGADCIYELVGKVPEAAAKPHDAVIQARCLARIADDGKIKRVLDVLEYELFEELDMRPYRVQEIEWEHRVFVLNKEIACGVRKEEAIIIIEYEPLNIRSYNYSREEAIRDFAEEFSVLWDTYVKEVEGNLTSDAIDLRNKLLSLVKEVK